MSIRETLIQGFEKPDLCLREWMILGFEKPDLCVRKWIMPNDTSKTPASEHRPEPVEGRARVQLWLAYHRLLCLLRWRD